MKRLSNIQIIAEIKDGNEEVLTYLGRRFFPSARRLMRIRGVHDADTPEMFSKVLASLAINFQKRKTINDIDFESSLFSLLNEHIKEKKNLRKKGNEMDDIINGLENDQSRIASQCVSILDEQSQKLLFARVVGKMNYEKIAQQFQYSNAVIAQYEVHKAFNLLEDIVKARLNLSGAESNRATISEN